MAKLHAAAASATEIPNYRKTSLTIGGNPLL